MLLVGFGLVVLTFLANGRDIVDSGKVLDMMVSPLSMPMPNVLSGGFSKLNTQTEKLQGMIDNLDDSSLSGEALERIQSHGSSISINGLEEANNLKHAQSLRNLHGLTQRMNEILDSLSSSEDFPETAQVQMAKQKVESIRELIFTILEEITGADSEDVEFDTEYQLDMDEIIEEDDEDEDEYAE